MHYPEASNVFQKVKRLKEAGEVLSVLEKALDAPVNRQGRGLD